MCLSEMICSVCDIGGIYQVVIQSRTLNELVGERESKEHSKRPIEGIQLPLLCVQWSTSYIGRR